MALVPRVFELLQENDLADIKIFVGGIIPDEDVPYLKDLGVVGIYGPGTLTEDIIRDVRTAINGNSES
jgi:methylmalonyl-CoA mutase C-terminal domain/subunit